MHFIHVYFISKDSFNFHSAIHQLEGCDLLCKCWRAWGHSGDAGRLCWQSPLPRARALRDAACLAQRFSRGVFLLNLRERFEANCTLLSHNALDAEGAQLISSACRLFAAIRPIFPWAFKHVWGEAQAKLRKDWVGKKKNIWRYLFHCKYLQRNHSECLPRTFSINIYIGAAEKAERESLLASVC